MGVKDRIKFYSKVPSVEECQALCDKDTECTGFVWYEKEGDYFNNCFGIIDGEFRMISSKGVTSGVKLNIYVADLSDIDIDDSKFTSLFINGKRQILARYPNGNPEYTGYHTANSGFAARQGRQVAEARASSPRATRSTWTSPRCRRRCTPTTRSRWAARPCSGRPPSPTGRWRTPWAAAAAPTPFRAALT